MNLTKRILSRWHKNDGFGHAAAVSFYAIFALSPLLAFGMALISESLSHIDAEVSTEIWLSDMLNRENARSILEVLEMNQPESHSHLALLTTAVLLAWFGSLIFSRLVFSTRRMMGLLKQKNSPTLRQGIKRRITGLFVALGIGLIMCLFVLVISVSTAFSVKEQPLSWMGILNSLIFTTGSLALVAFAPEKRPSRSALLSGALAVFAVIFAGRIVFQKFVTTDSLFSPSGAISAFFIALTWTYFLSLVHFLNAAFCREAGT